MDKEQISRYVELVTGAIPRSNATDLAGLLYSYYYSLDCLMYSLKHPENKLHYDIAFSKLQSLAKSILINAKFYEGIPIQRELF